MRFGIGKTYSSGGTVTLAKGTAQHVQEHPLALWLAFRMNTEVQMLDSDLYLSHWQV